MKSYAAPIKDVFEDNRQIRLRARHQSQASKVVETDKIEKVDHFIWPAPEVLRLCLSRSVIR